MNYKKVTELTVDISLDAVYDSATLSAIKDKIEDELLKIKEVDSAHVKNREGKK